MTRDFTEINAALHADDELKDAWFDLDLKWRKGAANFVRRRRSFQSKLYRAAYERVAAGERDVEKITDEVCGSFVTTLILSTLFRVFVELLVRKIIERYGD